MLTYVDCWTQVKSEMDKLFEELDEGDKASSVEPCSVSWTCAVQSNPTK